MQSSIQDFRNVGAEVVAISVDDVERNAQVTESLGLEFPILSDTTTEVIEAWGVVDQGAGLGGGDIARPATFVLDKDGVIRWRDLTSNWRIRAAPSKIIEEIQNIANSQG